ncbi:MAG: DMT family transporter [Opitutaceae bacterium]|nr:DMT family transporter [Opitutaceae bacterium]
MSSISPPHPQRTQALLMLLVANLCWGLSFPLIKSVLLLHERIIPEAGTWFSSIYALAPRFLLAFLVLLALRPRAWRGVTRGEFKQGLVIGLFASAGMFIQNDALQYVPASTSAFLTQFYAILIPVYVAVRARRNPGLRVWLSCALVLAGVAILGRFDWRQLHLGRGEWETLLASVFFMGQILWLEKKEFSANRAFELTLVMFATEALVFAVLAGATAPSVAALIVPWTSPVWLGFTVTLTVVCTLGAFGLMNAWQPKITATEAGLIYCVEPIFGSVAALFLPAIFSAWALINYPNELATWTLLVGGGLITAANILIQLKLAGKG